MIFDRFSYLTMTPELPHALWFYYGLLGTIHQDMTAVEISTITVVNRNSYVIMKKNVPFSIDIKLLVRKYIRLNLYSIFTDWSLIRSSMESLGISFFILVSFDQLRQIVVPNYRFQVLFTSVGYSLGYLAAMSFYIHPRIVVGVMLIGKPCSINSKTAHVKLAVIMHTYLLYYR